MARNWEARKNGCVLGLGVKDPRPPVVTAPHANLEKKFIFS
jgi:hypothetical protein